MATGTKAKSKTSTDVIVVDESTGEILAMNKRQDFAGNVNNLPALRQFVGQEITWTDIEPHFEVIKDKSEFADRPIIIGAFRFNESKDYQSPDANGVLEPTIFVSLMLAAYDPDSEDFTTSWVIVNDGSTGIRDQLRKMITRNTGEDAFLMTHTELNRHATATPPIKAEFGLRVSEYDYTDAAGAVSRASTWYIA